MVGGPAARETTEYFIQFRQTLGGPFSAVSTATIATKYSFFQDFRDLQDFHTFAPLRSQNFSKKVVTILSFLNKLNNLFNSNFMKNALKLVFFFEILMKFCRNFTNIFRKCQNLRIIAENSEKIAKIWSKSRNRWDYSIVEMNYSVVSLVAIGISVSLCSRQKGRCQEPAADGRRHLRHRESAPGYLRRGRRGPHGEVLRKFLAVQPKLIYY